MENSKIYDKYQILDNETKVPKQGKYFVLKLDTQDPIENEAVYMALWTYSTYQRYQGNSEYADELDKMINQYRIKKD